MAATITIILLAVLIIPYRSGTPRLYHGFYVRF